MAILPKAKLAAFWQARTLREQRLLLLMLLIVLPSIVVFGIVQPLNTALARNRSEALRLEGDNRSLDSLLAESATLSAKPAMPALGARDVQTMVEAAMAREAFASGQLKLAAEGEQGVHITGIAGFDAWLHLVGVLERESQIHVLRMSVLPGDAPGRIRLDAVLVHAGGEA